jgi:hypothetical protein
MKPNSLCLVEMGKKGLEMVAHYPDVLPKEAINEITIKSMPLGAKEGDFTSNVLTNDNAFSCFVFTIPNETGRDNIASLVAVFDSAEYSAINVRKIFSLLIQELKKQKAIDSEILAKILPSLHKGFDTRRVEIKISSVVTIEINYPDDDDESDKKSRTPDEYAKSVEDEMWK